MKPVAVVLAVGLALAAVGCGADPQATAPAYEGSGVALNPSKIEVKVERRLTLSAEGMPSGTARVEFYDGSERVAVSGRSPYRSSIPLTDSGARTYTAVALDAKGNVLARAQASATVELP